MKLAVQILSIITMIGCVIGCIILGVIIGNSGTIVEQIPDLTIEEKEAFVLLLNALLVIAIVALVIAFILNIVNLIVCAKPRQSGAPYIVFGVINILFSNLIVGVLLIVYGLSSDRERLN